MFKTLKDAAQITPNQWFDEDGKLHIPKGHKVSSHLDLFYDLVFVVALASLGKDFRSKAHEHHYEVQSVSAVWDMAALFIPILLNHLFLHGYSNRFGRGSFFSCVWYLVNFLRMYFSPPHLQGLVNKSVVLGLLTLNIKRCSASFDKPGGPFECADFSLFYGLSRLAITLAWARATLTSTVAPRYCAMLAIGHLITCLLWLVSISQQENPLAFHILWWAPVILDIGAMLVPLAGALVRPLFISNPVSTSKKDPSAFIPIDYHLYDERMGLITLLAMGESVTAASSVELHGESPLSTYGYSMLVVSTVFGLNMLYFRSGEALIKEGKHALRSNVNRGIFWILLHIPLVFLMLLKGSVSEIIIESLHDTPFLRAVYCIANGGIFVISALLQSLHEGGGKVEKKLSKNTRMLIRWGCGSLIIFVGYIPKTWIETPAGILGLVLAITATGVSIDTYGSLPIHPEFLNNHTELEDTHEM